MLTNFCNPPQPHHILPSLGTLVACLLSSTNLQCFVCFLSCYIVARFDPQVFLVRLAVLTFVYSLAGKTVLVTADFAIKEVDFVVVETESNTVG